MEAFVNMFLDVAAKVGVFVSIAFIALGLIYISFQEWIRAWKNRAGHFDKHHEYRKEIQEFGVKLITIGALIGSLMFTGLAFQRSQREFSAKIRPFLRAEPIVFEGGGLYEIVRTDSVPQARFRFRIDNVGTIPAYSVSTSRVLTVGNYRRMSEERERSLTVFPGDNVGVILPFNLTKDDAEMLQVLGKREGGRELILELTLSYRGRKSTRERPFYTSYKVVFSSPTQYRIENVEADELE